MATCPSCAHENRDGARFCEACGGPLAAPAVALPEERKTVTALFCDLVGFTATSEGADPEDVDRMLTTYFAMARAHVEAHGGVVEKFVGDAVLGVFGVPSAHEDDPERAVRAALRIVESATELRTLAGAPLRLRVGINTGEALVRLGVAPGSGERFLAGDAINTASRIQSAAPELGVAVGLPTYEATKTVFEYVELPPATLKGKAEPVRIFEARAPLARLGTDLTRTHAGPFVGREIDLALLRGMFEKSVAADAVGLVTVVGEPGLGKSRLVAELSAALDAGTALVTWRQGRCLPYGDGITFWALGEIVKAHAGILESDPAAVAIAKLDAVLPEGDERAWLRQRLLPLLGIEASSPAAQEELFTAWRRFLEHVAEAHPTVLVFEDLHWADPALLAFLEHVADRAEGVPLLLVGTARPELFERQPGFAGGLRTANRINLAPLSDAETSRLVAGLVGDAVPAELVAPILERSEGNPLYAEEYVRLLRDRELLVETDGAVALRSGATVPLPDSIGALIAARIDTLPADRKSMLADAAVVGKVFWAGAVAAMGERDRDDVTEALRELGRKELVRAARRSSIAGEAEYAFWHVLTRDVAYATLPRASRAARHVAAARWLEATAADRVEDRADMLAYHYGTALELARAAGPEGLAEELEAPAFRFLSLAGERALGLDANAALTSLERALQLAPAGHPDRAAALARYGNAAFQAGRYAEARSAFEAARSEARAGGDVATEARVLGRLSVLSSRLGEPHFGALAAEALALLEPLGPSPALVDALTEVARAETLEGDPTEGIRFAERALELSAELGLPTPARALGYRGHARTDGGDAGGIHDMREALALALKAGQGRDVAVLYLNLSASLLRLQGPAASTAVAREGVAYARDRGLAEIADVLTGNTLLAQAGDLDALLEVVAREVPRLDATGDTAMLVGLRSEEAMIRALRGEADAVEPWVAWLEQAARATEDWQSIPPALTAAALVRAQLGDDAKAVALLADVEAYPGVRDTLNHAVALPSIIRAAVALHERELAGRFVRGFEPRYPYAEHALVAAKAILAEADGDLEAAAAGHADAAARWERFGVVTDQAFALLGQGRCLLALGRPAEARHALARARTIFERLRARPALAETDELLRRVTAMV